MPNFDCDGGGCGSILCQSCTPESTSLKFHEEYDAIVAAAHAKNKPPPSNTFDIAVARARSWQRDGGTLGQQHRALTAAAKDVCRAELNGGDLKKAVRRLRDLLTQQKKER